MGLQSSKGFRPSPTDESKEIFKVIDMFSIFPQKKQNIFKTNPKLSSALFQMLCCTVLKHNVSIFRVSEFLQHKNGEFLVALPATHFQIRCFFLLKGAHFHKYTVVFFSGGSGKQLMCNYSVSKPTTYFSEYCFQIINLKLFY